MMSRALRTEAEKALVSIQSKAMRIAPIRRPTKGKRTRALPISSASDA